MKEISSRQRPKSSNQKGFVIDETEVDITDNKISNEFKLQKDQ